MRQEILEELSCLKDEDYRIFNQKLLPGVDHILGVRLPELRKIAKKIAKADALHYLTQLRGLCTAQESTVFYEEKMLYGMVIGYAKMADNEYKEWLDAFVPVIDNWGVCDSCCTTYKWMKKQPEFWWEYLLQWADSDTEYGIRFAAVCMLDHFVEEAYLPEIFDAAGRIRHEGYYAKMAAAWLISVCFMHFPDETYAFLKERRLDDFTWKKAIQKACESYKVSAEWKQALRSLRG